MNRLEKAHQTVTDMNKLSPSLRLEAYRSFFFRDCGVDLVLGDDEIGLPSEDTLTYEIERQYESHSKSAVDRKTETVRLLAKYQSGVIDEVLAVVAIDNGRLIVKSQSGAKFAVHVSIGNVNYDLNTKLRDYLMNPLIDVVELS